MSGTRSNRPSSNWIFRSRDSPQVVAWIRGILANDYGVELDRVRWVSFEDAHVVADHRMVVVRESLSKSNPRAVQEVFRLPLQSKKAAGLPSGGGIDLNPFGVEANRRNLEIAIDYVHQQRLIPGRFEVDELFDDVMPALGS